MRTGLKRKSPQEGGEKDECPAARLAAVAAQLAGRPENKKHAKGNEANAKGVKGDKSGAKDKNKDRKTDKDRRRQRGRAVAAGKVRHLKPAHTDQATWLRSSSRLPPRGGPRGGSRGKAINWITLRDT